MELVAGRLGELRAAAYVDCPEEGCAYTLDGGVLMRHRRSAEHVFGSEPPLAVNPDLDAIDHERPRLRRIVRILAENAATDRLASPYIVFVPRPGALEVQSIDAGSGIVGMPNPGAERVSIDYEGGRYRQVGMDRLADRVFHAYGRLLVDFPTIARSAVPRASVVEVGTFHPPTGTITLIDAASEAALSQWLGAEEFDPAELICTGGAP